MVSPDTDGGRVIVKRELAEEIYLECPLIFRGDNGGRDRKLMKFEFDCGDGWFWIIKALSLEIERIAQKLMEAGVEEDSLPLVSRVKEKYAMLRFYVRNTTDEIENFIHQAQAESFVTCERCGKPGEIEGETYFRVLCDACRFDK